MHQHLYYRDARKDKREREGQRKVSEEIIAENLPNMGRESLTKNLEAQRA